jgi:hypothetical protein
MSNVVINSQSCWVEVDERGAVRGVSMPDGTPIPEVSAVELSADACEVQVAKITLSVRVRQDGPPKSG